MKQVDVECGWTSGAGRGGWGGQASSGWEPTSPWSKDRPPVYLKNTCELPGILHTENKYWLYKGFITKERLYSGLCFADTWSFLFVALKLGSSRATILFLILLSLLETLAILVDHFYLYTTIEHSTNPCRTPMWVQSVSLLLCAFVM